MAQSTINTGTDLLAGIGDVLAAAAARGHDQYTSLRIDTTTRGVHLILRPLPTTDTALRILDDLGARDAAIAGEDGDSTVNDLIRRVRVGDLIKATATLDRLAGYRIVLWSDPR